MTPTQEKITARAQEILAGIKLPALDGYGHWPVRGEQARAKVLFGVAQGIAAYEIVSAEAEAENGPHLRVSAHARAAGEQYLRAHEAEKSLLSTLSAVTSSAKWIDLAYYRSDLAGKVANGLLAKLPETP